MGFPGSSDGKESACNARDLGLIPGSVKFSGEGSGYLLQYSCLENPMDREAWKTIVHRVAKSQMQLRQTVSLSVMRPTPGRCDPAS